MKKWNHSSLIVEVSCALSKHSFLFIFHYDSSCLLGVYELYVLTQTGNDDHATLMCIQQASSSSYLAYKVLNRAGRFCSAIPRSDLTLDMNSNLSYFYLKVA